MATTIILLQANDLTKNTIIIGNVDVDRYLPLIKAAQKVFIKPLIGQELYNKICQDFKDNTLTGLYLELYDDYIKDMLIYKSAELYLETGGAYLVSNAGILKTKTDESETVSKNEIDYMVEANGKLYNQAERAFIKWIKVNGPNIPEYTLANSCSKPTDIINVGGWSLRRKGGCC